MNRRSCSSGFSLIEVIAALVILSTIGVSLINLSSRITEGQGRLQSHAGLQRQAWNVLIKEWVVASAWSGQTNREALTQRITHDTWQVELMETPTAARMLVKKTARVSHPTSQREAALSLYLVAE